MQLRHEVEGLSEAHDLVQQHVATATKAEEEPDGLTAASDSPTKAEEGPDGLTAASDSPTPDSELYIIT